MPGKIRLQRSIHNRFWAAAVRSGYGFAGTKRSAYEPEHGKPVAKHTQIHYAQNRAITVLSPNPNEWLAQRVNTRRRSGSSGTAGRVIAEAEP